MAITNGLNISAPNQVVITNGSGIPTASLSLPAATTLNGVSFATSTNGTFTPSLTLGGGSTGITYDAQQGFYTIFPGVYFFSLLIDLSNKGSDTGFVKIIGLPFSSRNVGSAFLINNLSIQNGVSLPSGLAGVTINLDNTILLTGDTAIGGAPLLDTNVANNTTFTVSGMILI